MLAAKLHLAASHPEFRDVLAAHGLATDEPDRIAAE